jgi:hypothetical protein
MYGRSICRGAKHFCIHWPTFVCLRFVPSSGSTLRPSFSFANFVLATGLFFQFLALPTRSLMWEVSQTTEVLFDRTFNSALDLPVFGF